MASRLALPSSSLTLLLATLFLVTAIGCDKALTCNPSYPKYTIQRQEEQAITEVVLDTTGEPRKVEEAEEKEERNIMAAVARPASTSAALKSWPDLVGLDGEEAKKKILEEHPNLKVQIVPDGSFVKADYNLGRVRIYTNSDKKVSKAPRMG